MTLMDAIHNKFLLGRRAQVLSEHLAAALPSGSSVLDVGCGDGKIARMVMDLRPDVDIRGIDVLVRPDTAIPVEEFDGVTFPAADNSYDTVTFVDVLHHTDNPTDLLREASRVARTSVVVKDHVVSGLLAEPTLKFMDVVGNERHGVVLPFNYLSNNEWDRAFSDAGLAVDSRNDDLGLYPWPASLVFDRDLHMVTSLSLT